MLRRYSYAKSRVSQKSLDVGDVICEPPIVKRVTPPVADGSFILDCRLSFSEQNRSHCPRVSQPSLSQSDFFTAYFSGILNRGVRAMMERWVLF